MIIVKNILCYISHGIILWYISHCYIMCNISHSHILCKISHSHLACSFKTYQVIILCLTVNFRAVWPGAILLRHSSYPPTSYRMFLLTYLQWNTCHENIRIQNLVFQRSIIFATCVCL